MADPFGRPADPDSPRDRDPIDEQLRGLARDTESLVVLAGPDAARRLGERRSARRRTGALSAAVALALAVGSWQLLPRLGADPHGAPVGSGAGPTSAPKTLTARLADELLPASALPMFPKWTWRTIPEPTVGKLLGLCDVAPSSGVTASATRAYATDGGQAAVYRLYAFGTAEDAAKAEVAVSMALKGKCRVELTSHADAKTPQGPAEYRGESVGSSGLQVWMRRQGNYVAVLFVFGPGNLQTQKSDSLYDNAWPQKCIAGSLNRLASGTSTPTPTPTGTPTGTPTPTTLPASGGATSNNSVPPTSFVIQPPDSGTESGSGTTGGGSDKDSISTSPSSPSRC